MSYFRTSIEAIKKDPEICRAIIQSLQIQKLNITKTRLEFFQILNIKGDAYHGN